MGRHVSRHTLRASNYETTYHIHVEHTAALLVGRGNVGCRRPSSRARPEGKGVIVQKAGRGLLLRCLHMGLGGHFNAVGDVECGFGAAFLGRDHRNGWGVKGIVP